MILFSAPGRTEIGGNHTDHQHGCVLAAAVNLDMTARVTRTDSNVIRVYSDGYAPVEVVLDDLMDHYEIYTDEEKAQIKEVFQNVADLNTILDKYDVDARTDLEEYAAAYCQYFGMMLY